ncbi:MAG: hypothetical protein Ct9H300mP1_28360 [Planctomycetaceae bacterium]|nr:MAG: hypothetical protein Ct9H300mP1_28360 [Planctomycetaceae bacterium]
MKSRVVGPGELQLIQKSNPKAVIEVSRIKDSDDLGLFSGEQARGLDILVTQPAETRPGRGRNLGVSPPGR